MRRPLPLIAILLLIGTSVSARADDTDIFLSAASIEPNVVLLIDTSGSMNEVVDGRRKIVIARRVVTDLISRVEGVRFGVFAFDEDGARIVAPVGTPKQVMINRINALTADGYTPLGRAARDIQRYYRGEYGETAGGGTVQRGRAPQVVTYPSPIQLECQVNYAILMTDGMPTRELEDENLVAVTAKEMHTSDHSPLDGVQRVDVHTIGFDVPEGAELLTRTARDGGGSFYTATSYAELEAALSDAIETVMENVYSFAMPTIPATSTGDGARAYVARFRPSNGGAFWDGLLAAYARDANGRIPVDADGQPLGSALVWEAGAALAARSPGSRTIETWAGGAMQSVVTGNPAISRALLAVQDDVAKDKVIDFVRGVDSFDADGDGDTTEERSWKLGAIIHSAPVLVGPPPLRSAEPSYRTFRQSTASRPAILLVGADDGMLHAFRASDGEELWGFIPPDLLDDLKKMTGAGAHPYYVDATPTVADVEIDGRWKTVAVFGTRRGGRSYHALDITDTANPVFMWSATDAEMGETWSEPAIGKIRLADGSTMHAAFVGGGFDTANNNASGRAVYALDVRSGAIRWKYSNTGSADDRYMNFSIPAAPRVVDLDGDGFLDRVYVGDIGGQLWKFDVSEPPATFGGTFTNWTGKRLFVATPSQANPPPSGEYYPARGMYATPALAYDELGQLWVYVGTGDRNHPNAAAAWNRIYGLEDDGDMTNGAQLTEAALADSTAGAVSEQGWYVPLAANERIWTAAEIYNAIVYFTSYTPQLAASCENALGSARLYAMRMANGHLGLDWTDGESLADTDPFEQRWIDAGEGAPAGPQVIPGSSADSVTVGTSEGEITTLDLSPLFHKRLRCWREVF